MNSRQTFTAATLIVFCSILCSCASPKFEREWNRSVAEYKTQRTSTPTGPWNGKWLTKTNGHEGALRCIVTEVENQPGKLQFWYHATWAEVFSAPFKVKYDIEEKSRSHFKIEGTENLGVFGTFNHDATITASSFTAKYSNKKGAVGRFKMDRPD